MKKITKLLMLSLSLVAVLTSCDPESPDGPKDKKLTLNGALVLNQGGWGTNNASISLYKTDSNKVYSDIYEIKTGHQLGDLAQDMQIYGSKLYTTLHGSNLVVVQKLPSGELLDTIRYTSNGNPGQPWGLECGNGYVYVVMSGTNELVRIDTTTLSINNKVAVGVVPNFVARYNGRLYVTNQGGYNMSGTTVSVINESSFQEDTVIAVAQNPSIIESDNRGGIYLISSGDYTLEKAHIVQCINTETYKVDTITDFKATYMNIPSNSRYGYFLFHYPWSSLFGPTAFVKYDLVDKTVVSTNFITDGTVINNPAAFGIDPLNNDIYVCTSNNNDNGDVFVFSSAGVLKTQFEVGVFPIKILFNR